MQNRLLKKGNKPLRERIVSLQRFEREAIGTLHGLIARGNLDAVAMILKTAVDRFQTSIRL